MNLADPPFIAPLSSRSSTLAEARERLRPPAPRRPSLWPVLASAFAAAFAALAAAATVILAAPALGAPSQAVFAPVSHLVGN